MNDTSPKPPSRGVSMTTLILTATLTATTAVAVVLAVLYFSGGASGQAFVQRDTVKPQGHATGEVVYPIPYAVPPHLTLTAAHRPYTIVKQSETGFSWAADDIADDFSGDTAAIKTALQNHNVASAVNFGQFGKKLDVVYEDFTWEAKGVAAGAAAGMDLPFEQSGSFQSVLGTEGQENFAIPYASPPQVTLTGHNGSTIIVEATNTGFKWKNSGKDNPFPGNNEGTVTWTAKGIRATKLPK